MEAERTYEQLCAELSAGDRLPSPHDRRRLPFNKLLALQKLEREILWDLTPEQRKVRCMRGELSPYQRSVWICGAAEEVPMVNGGVPPWIAATLIDIVEDGLSD